MTRTIIDQLLKSDEPSIRFKTRANVLGEKPESEAIQELREKVRKSPRVTKLLSQRLPDGSLPHHPYKKWFGAHWILATLADIGYPPNDESLIPMRNQVYDWLLSEGHWKGIKTISGRVRRCASQESNCVYSTLTLGIADERTDELVRRLIEWQWPDGGWNCDKRPEAVNSSYHESIVPLRALSLYARLKASDEAQVAAERAAEIFLKRRLFKRQSDGSAIKSSFAQLFYPPYWHYGILCGLKVMAEADFIHDERSSDALDLLRRRVKSCSM
ncbi:hypothetical protein J7M28_03655 [bacterium]|nr:hypothetical protein [bacterium]